MLLGAALMLFGLGCGRTSPYETLCAQSNTCAATVLPCHAGAITGEVCATDQSTLVNGAAVSVDAVDCHGAAVHVQTTTDAQGSFTLSAVPPGTWTVHAALGDFSQDLQVKVVADQTTALHSGQLCLAQHEVRIAVVTGAGDKIEHLLRDLKLKFTLVEGSKSTWQSGGEPFLADLKQLQLFDLVFIDCAAASIGGFTVDFGPRAATIEDNLRQYVLQGGSLYASDWSVVFASAAAPGAFDVVTATPEPITSPMDAHRLLGFAPQQVSAQVVDPALRTFLGKDTLAINFPREPNAMSEHWGLLNQVAGAEVLARADGVRLCPDDACAVPGGERDGVPLAVRLKLTPPEGRGGYVLYTSFHNVAQSGPDVAQMLKYLVLNL